MTSSRGEAQFFLQRLEERRVLSVASFVPVAGISSLASAAPAELGQFVASQSQRGHDLEQSRRIVDDLAGGSLFTSAPAAQDADRSAALFNQAISLPAGSPGAHYLWQLHSQWTNEEAPDAPADGLGDVLCANLEGGAAGTGQEELLSARSSPNLGSPAPNLPTGGEATLAGLASGTDSLLAGPGSRVPTPVSDQVEPRASLVVESAVRQVGPISEQSNGSNGTVVVSVGQANDGEPVGVVSPDANDVANAHDAGLAGDLATGDLSSIRLALENLLAELGRFDPDGVGTSARLELLLWLSSAAAAAVVGCEIARRQLPRASLGSAARHSSAATVRPHVDEPLLA